METGKEQKINNEKLRIGIFGGSFNPIHVGHLALANYLCEYGELDELWFMISPQNPFKEEKDLLDEKKRIELVRLSIKGYKKFKASDFEFSLPRPSYTVYTLENLRKIYTDYNFILVIGSDNWITFDKWKESARLLSENEILIYPRVGFNILADQLPPNVRLVSTPLLEISSTFIREGIRQGKDLRFFLSSDAYKKIKREKLYL